MAVRKSVVGLPVVLNAAELLNLSTWADNTGSVPTIRAKLSLEIFSCEIARRIFMVALSEVGKINTGDERSAVKPSINSNSVFLLPRVILPCPQLFAHKTIQPDAATTIAAPVIYLV